MIVTMSVHNATMMTRRNPVLLKVFKLTNGTTAVPGRTKPLFFQETLNLSQGKLFKFDIDKWKAIISSGIFQNLTVNSVHTDEGVYLNITGFEAPSISLSPEATFTASLDNPEILGGVSWKDFNFMGMGDKLALSILKKEGLEEGMQYLKPMLKVKWAERGIGKMSKISVSHEEDNVFEYFNEVFARPFHNIYSFLRDANGNNIHNDRTCFRSSTTAVELSTIISTEELHKHSLGGSLSSVRYGLQPFIRTIVSLSPSSCRQGSADRASDEVAANTRDSSAGSLIEDQQLMNSAVGGRNFLECEFKNGGTLRSWYEGGSVVSRPAIASSGRFHQVGLAVNLPSLNLPGLRIPSTRKVIPINSSRDENAPSHSREQSISNKRPVKDFGNIRRTKQTPTILPTDGVTAVASVDMPTTMISTWRNKLSSIFQNVEMVGKVKLHGISSWGSGCIPAQHHASLSSPNLVRCLSSHTEKKTATISTSTGILNRAQNLLSIQRDLYVKGLLPAEGVVGVFADTGLFQRPVEHGKADREVRAGAAQRIESFLTAGVSLRALGFRVDCGTRMLRKNIGINTPQFHFGFDFGD